MLYAITYLLMCACTQTDDLLEPAGKLVTINFSIGSESYDVPVTRMGEASESKITNLWMLVFKDPTGTTSDIGDYVFVEAVKASAVSVSSTTGEGAYSVSLTEQTVKCRIMILANAQDKFYYGASDITGFAFNATSLNAQLSNKTLSVVSTNLLTEPLGSTALQAVPFTSPKTALPMSSLYGVEKIDQHTVIGDPTSVSLVRAVAKVIVTNSATTHTLEGAAVLKAPQQAQWYRHGTLNVTTKTTSYWGVAGNEIVSIAAATALNANSQSTASNPIYIYESVAGTETAVVLQMTEKSSGKTCYYRVGFRDSSSENLMSAARNYQYTINITEIRDTGFTDLQDAIDAPIAPLDYLKSIVVKEEISHDIVDNGAYYIGFTNSVYRICADPAANYTGLVAFTATTGATSIPANHKIEVVSGTGLSLTQAPTVIQAADGVGGPKATDIKINVTSAFTGPGKIRVLFGTFDYELTVERGPVYRAGNKVSFEKGVPSGKEYYMAEVGVDSSSSDYFTWLDLSPFGRAIRSDNKVFYAAYEDYSFDLHISSSASAGREGILYLNESDYEGRVKTYIKLVP